VYGSMVKSRQRNFNLQAHISYFAIVNLLLREKAFNNQYTNSKTFILSAII
jgi:hypothetical protein